MRKGLLAFFLISLIIQCAMLVIIPLPGYMDAEYYYAGGKTLYQQHQFLDYYIWNYLSTPPSIPFPSHQYWLPSASILAMLGMLITGSAQLWAARIPFVVLSACIPPLVFWVGYQFTEKKTVAFLAGIFALFSGVYLRYLSQTDTFPILMLCGLGIFYFFQKWNSKPDFLTGIWIGLLCGVIYLSRAEGIIWVILIGISVIVSQYRHVQTQNRILSRSGVAIGFLLLAVPWLLHNLLTSHQIGTPGGLRSLWLTSYDDLFVFPSTTITLQRWFDQGWLQILTIRGKAAGINLLTVLGIHSLIILIPGIWVGLRKTKSDSAVSTMGWIYLILFLLMSIVFPFAGTRGGFLHAAAVIQPVIWILAAVGYDQIGSQFTNHRIFSPNRIIIGVSLIVFAISVFAAVTVDRKQYSGLQKDAVAVGEHIRADHGSAEPIVMTNDPPGFYLQTGFPTIMLPVNGINSIFALADYYHANYLVIREELLHALNLADGFWIGSNRLRLLDEISSYSGNRIFLIKILPDEMP